MKQWIFLILLGCSLYACEQEVDIYSGSSSIYFDDENAGEYGVSWGILDSDIKKQTIQLKVNLFGAVKDYPRKFNIQVVSDKSDSLYSAAGVDYTPLPLEYELPAMANHVYIPVELLRTDTLLKQARRFTIQLLTNEEFGFEYMNYETLEDSVGTVAMVNDHCTIYMDEKFPKPWWWNRVGEPIFGEWSITKGILICDVENIDRKRFQGDIDGLDGNLSEALLKFIGRKMYLWLQENPTLDEDGELMEMGEDSSY